MENPFKKASHTTISLKRVSMEDILWWWYKKSGIVFAVLFFGIVVVIGYVWYFYLYAYVWTPDREASYYEEQTQSVHFSENKFLQVVGMTQARKSLHDAPYEVSRDIFEGKNLE